MISKKRFYQLSFLLPLVLPLLLFPFKNAVTIFFALALGFAGLPYVLFIGLFLFLSWRKDARFFEKACWYIPPLFGIFTAVAWLLYEAVSRGNLSTMFTLDNIAEYAMITTAYSCILGYFYVITVRLLGYALWRDE